MPETIYWEDGAIRRHLSCIEDVFKDGHVLEVRCGCGTAWPEGATECCLECVLGNCGHEKPAVY